MNRALPAAAQQFCKQLGIRYPVIGGAMYPCSNPELTAAVSAAGGIGILQPISLTYVHGHEYRKGIRLMQSLTDKPIGMNALIEKSSKKYQQRMSEWVDIALEEGIRFFVTSLGKPDWVAQRVHAVGGLVYHDVTELKWARIGLDNGADGLICVNNRAGGHAGQKSMRQLFEELHHLGVPLVCAGGIGEARDFHAAMDCGYAACQLGTRFIASKECRASEAYKQAVVDAGEADIVLSERVTGVPVSVINTEFIRRSGTRLGWFARWMLRGSKTRHWMRIYYGLKSVWQLKRASLDEKGEHDYWQAGKSVAGIGSIESCESIMQQLINPVVEDS
ncbi:MAG: nitronate monooxygenase [Gammaproteobacteria bacterium]|nr:nitronate monooxygenase [Gammaproteobacteria bacterium]MDH3448686.1 nitronate monooxygenase [Gammaproteobacteria bacterium]